MKNPWETLRQKIVYTGFLGHRLQIYEVIGPSGRESEYFVVEVKSNATILPITTDGKVVVENTWRYPIKREFLELPVGGIEAKEEPLDTAKRELMEETGYTGGEWEFLGSFYDNNSYSTAKTNIFLARNVIPGKAENSDENELLEVELIDVEVLKKMVLDETIQDGRTKMAVLLAMTKGLI
jgi:ADP-ribose pyrophosphatase